MLGNAAYSQSQAGRAERRPETVGVAPERGARDLKATEAVEAAADGLGLDEPSPLKVIGTRQRDRRLRRPDTNELVVAGPTTLDFTLTERSDAFGYTCGPEDAAFEEADTVLAITGDDAAGTIDRIEHERGVVAAAVLGSDARGACDHAPYQ